MKKMKISIGNDHAGTQHKKEIVKHIEKKGIETVNHGTDGEESVDYPDLAHPVAEDVKNKRTDLGIVICGSGNGVAMTANKHNNIRAAICWNKEMAKLAREHNDANIISIPARVVSINEAKEIVEVFLNTGFEGGRHKKNRQNKCQMKIEVKKFKDLSNDEIYGILKLRSEVFVVEQECVYQDIDGKDKKAMHLMGKKDNEIIAYTRILDSGDYYELPSIARVVVKKKTRGEERGKEIMKESIKYIKENLQEKTIVLAAQKYLDKFYKELGFIVEGEEYLEDGIPHQKMKLKP